MTANKRYEILDSLPAYGPMYIPVSVKGELFYSEGFVVRFTQSDEVQWVANFEPGWTDLGGVYELNDTSNLMILANGTCYIMNPDSVKPVSAFGAAYSKVFPAKDGRMILQNPMTLTIIQPDGTFWHSERISWDGLDDLQVSDNIVTGLAYDPTKEDDEWTEFTYNIDTKELIGGSYPKSAKKEKSKWWFW